MTVVIVWKAHTKKKKDEEKKKKKKGTTAHDEALGSHFAPMH